MLAGSSRALRTLRCRAAAPPRRRAARARASLAERLGQRAGERSRRRGLLEVRASNGAAVRWWNARLHRVAPVRSHAVRRTARGARRPASASRSTSARRRAACPGFRCADVHRGSVAVRLRWQAAPEMPWTEFGRLAIEVVGAEAFRLVLSAPTACGPAATFRLHLRAEDGGGTRQSSLKTSSCAHRCRRACAFRRGVDAHRRATRRAGYVPYRSARTHDAVAGCVVQSDRRAGDTAGRRHPAGATCTRSR